MPRLARLVLVAVAVTVSIAGAESSSAGQRRQAGAGKGIDPAAAKRSQGVVAELARIEANKEAFVDELLGSWAPSLDPAKVDLMGTVKPIAMAATPWRLLGASLTTDFESGFRVLRGVVGPGVYVSAYIEGREPQSGIQTQAAAADATADALGATGNSLVFTPIAPCRVVDTRGTGVRTGMLPAGSGSGRAFDFTSGFSAKGQGGQLTPCPGLPSAQPNAWAVNITVAGYAATGYLTVEPAGGTISATSFMNFAPGPYAIANAGTVTGSTALTDSAYIWTFAPTHVIVDVSGYYSEATGFATGAVSWLAGAEWPIDPANFDYNDGAACPAGTKLIGGGSTNDSADVTLLTGDRYDNGNVWREWYRNTGAVTAKVITFSRCIDVK